MTILTLVTIRALLTLRNKVYLRGVPQTEDWYSKPMSAEKYLFNIRLFYAYPTRAGLSDSAGLDFA